MSHVTCHMSNVICQVSCVTSHFFLNEQTGRASRGRVYYQWGPHSLVSRVFSLALMMELSPSWGSSRFTRPTLPLLPGQWWCQVFPMAWKCVPNWLNAVRSPLSLLKVCPKVLHSPCTLHFSVGEYGWTLFLRDENMKHCQVEIQKKQFWKVNNKSFSIPRKSLF